MLDRCRTSVDDYHRNEATITVDGGGSIQVSGSLGGSSPMAMSLRLALTSVRVSDRAEVVAAVLVRRFSVAGEVAVGVEPVEGVGQKLA